jgi:AraC family transcriptional regulator
MESGDVIALNEGGRSVTYDLTASGTRVVDVVYPASTDFDTHRHDAAYLCLAVTGEYAEWMGDGTMRTVRAGGPVVYEAGSSHAVGTGPEPIRIIHVTDPAGRDWSDAHPLAPGLLWQIAAELGTPPAAGEDLHLESLVCELVSPAVPGERGRPGHAEIQIDAGEGWLRGIRDRIRDTHDRPVSLAELADDFDRHPAHLARAFRARWGITPGEYLRRIRVSAAVTALSRTGDPASVIALDTGFSDQSHMGRWVRRYTGRTPGWFRGLGFGPRG